MRWARMCSKSAAIGSGEYATEERGEGGGRGRGVRDGMRDRCGTGGTGSRQRAARFAGGRMGGRCDAARFARGAPPEAAARGLHGLGAVKRVAGLLLLFGALAV